MDNQLLGSVQAEWVPIGEVRRLNSLNELHLEKECVLIYGRRVRDTPIVPLSVYEMREGRVINQDKPYTTVLYKHLVSYPVRERNGRLEVIISGGGPSPGGAVFSNQAIEEGTHRITNIPKLQSLRNYQ